MSAVCRRMTLADVPQVHAIEERTFATPWSYQSFVDEMTTNKCARYLVAEEDGRVIAYDGAWLIFEEGHITNIAVDEPYRGRGVGTEVTRALMQYAANMGVQYLTLEVRRSNLVAQKMYQSLGFLKLGLRKRYYEDMTQMEIAKELGISQAQVSRLEKNAIRTLKKEMEQ